MTPPCALLRTLQVRLPEKDENDLFESLQPHIKFILICNKYPKITISLKKDSDELLFWLGIEQPAQVAHNHSIDYRKGSYEHQENQSIKAIIL